MIDDRLSPVIGRITVTQALLRFVASDACWQTYWTAAVILGVRQNCNILHLVIGWPKDGFVWDWTKGRGHCIDDLNTNRFCYRIVYPIVYLQCDRPATNGVEGDSVFRRADRSASPN